MKENLMQRKRRYLLSPKKELTERCLLIEEEKKIPEKIDLAWQNSFDEQVQQDCIK